MKIMKNFLKNILKLFSNSLAYRGMYVILSGERAGGFFVYIKEEDRGKCNAILFMPNPMEALYVNNTEILMDIKYDNIMFVKKLPLDVYLVCKANFIYYAKKVGTYASR